MTTTTALPMDVILGAPEPVRSRWQPLRAGILNLFLYDEQVFAFHNGRLLLRGNNGTGKSMALEVLLPYLLDAELTCACRKPRPRHASRRYSLIRPPIRA